jgi:ferric-dicitrate binding protein FerR (iron transport regulator)
MEQSDLNNLLDRYLRGICTAQEQMLVEQWLENNKTEPNDWTEMSNAAKDLWMASLLGDVRKTLHLDNQKDSAIVHKMQRRVWLRVAAAASVIGLLILGSYFWFNRGEEKEIVKTEIKDQRYKDDVSPGGNKAVLTLADGSTVILDDAQNGALAQQGNTKVIKLGGKLAYDPASTGAKEVLYNTIATPRGGQYQIELPDGSQVWLNAASSLRFPTAFVGKERRVEITGEAYFEVAKDKAMPFIVSVNGAEVQVLGTHFDVMAYREEKAIKTTLLEGSVRFVSGNNASMLKPGQQSQMTKEGQVKVVSDIDVEKVMAWKNGLFHFENADIETVMRQLARWYDIEVVYQSKRSNDLFHVEIQRNTKLSDALKILEVAGGAKFEIEGKTVYVIQ